MKSESWRKWVTDITLDLPAGNSIDDAIGEMVKIAWYENIRVHAEINDIWISVGPDDSKAAIIDLYHQARKDRDESEKKKANQPKLEYNRTVVYRDKEVEVVVIVWPPHSKSPIHDHGKSYGTTFVVKGYIYEESWDKATGKIYSHRRFGPTMELRETPYHIHRIGNGTDEIAVTLHIYSPPLKMKFYTEKQMFGPEKM